MAIEKQINKSTPTQQQTDPRLSEELTSEGSPYVQTEYDNGDVEFDFSEEGVDAVISSGVPNIELEHYENIAEVLDEAELQEIGADVQSRYEDDKESRADHMETIAGGLSLLGVHVEETDDPFPGACAAHHPLILEAAVKFQAKASNELFNAKGPVRTAVVGTPTEEKEEQAQRVRNHMNYQVMHEMEDYFDEQEQLLFYLPIVGSCFKKVYYDALRDRPAAMYVPLDNLVINYYASSLRGANCYTHVIERNANDLKKDQVSGMYRDVELAPVPTRTDQGELQLEIDEQMGFSASSDDGVYTLLEQYCYLHLEEDPKKDPDGIALPYVVTVENETGKVLAIRRNWRETDHTQDSICPFTHYKFVPGMGFYGLGFIHLLGNLQMTLTSAMRSLVDSGTFANLQGGFIDKRLRIRDNDGPIPPGRFKEVEAGGLDLDKAIKTLPFKEPSNVLLSMYKFIEERGQKFADSTEQVVSDSSNYGPVGTTMALLESSAKFFSGVHKRLHKAQKVEFNILAAINYEYLEESESFDAVGATFEVRKDDYNGIIDVVPVSDPNLSSQSQKMTLAQAVYTAMLQNPQIHDAREVTRYYYYSIGVDEELVDKFLPKEEEPEQRDPMSDLLAVQQGEPIKAFPGQDHDAHVQVKTAFTQDPATGGNPALAPLTPLIQANIQEHLVLKFQEQTQGQMSIEEMTEGQAAQKAAETNQRLMELEAKGPDEARSKLADAEIMRVINEGRKLDGEAEERQVKLFHDSIKLDLDKYKTDTQYAIAQIKEQNDQVKTQLKEMNEIVKEASKLNVQEKQMAQQRETLTLNKDKGVASKDTEE